MPKRIDNISGQPVVFRTDSVHYWSCCDCGLTHLVLLTIRGKNILVTMYRDDYSTKQERKAIAKKLAKEGK